MTFKSTRSNVRQNREENTNASGGVQGNIPYYDAQGNLIDSGKDFEFLINTNFHKGGHHQYDTYAEIEAIPDELRLPGMVAHLNSIVDLQSSIPTVYNPTTVAQVTSRKLGYALTLNEVIVLNPETGTQTNISLPSNRRYLMAKTEDKFYFS